MTPAAAAFAIVGALFAVGAGIIVLFGGAAGRAGELWRHYGATLLIVAAVLVPALVHPALFSALAALAAWRCAVELAELHGLRLAPSAHATIALAALAAVALARNGPALMALSALLVLAVTPVYVRAVRGVVDGTARWTVALAFPLVAAAHLSALAFAENGFLWICLVYGVVEVQDSMAFLVGKLFGRRLLAPRLSPRKTVEGALAGALAGVAVGVLMGVLLLGERWPMALALAIVVALAGFGGDLFASALKRAAGVKDFRPLHARHGGLLDIYDSTLAAAVPASVVLWLAS